MSSKQNLAVSVAQCESFRERFEEGQSTGQIADETGFGNTTVRRHVHDNCSHVAENGGWGGADETDCPLCGESVVRQNLSLHLPKCPAAGPPERPPVNRGGRA